MLEKNFRVSESCGSCEYFAKRSAKIGYCTHALIGELPRRDYDGKWEDMEAVWNDEERHDFIERVVLRDYTNGINYRHWTLGDATNYAGKSFDSLLISVKWWKENRGIIHECNKDNLCDEYLGKNRGNPSAKHYVNLSSVKWLDKLE